MDKNFFEVFPVLQVNGEMRQLLADTQVQRVVSNRERTRLRIYLHGTRLIPKKQIFQLERSIKSQLFPGQELTVKIMEHYQLSAQYTPQTLMDIYKDSILEELKVYSLLIYNLFRCARMEFDGAGNMKLYLEDSIVARNRSDELLEVLYKIMRDRCGMMLTIDAVFEPKKENRLKKESDQQIACEIRRILGGVHRLEKTAGMGYANASGMGSAPEASRAGNVEKAGDKKAGAAEKDSARTAANGRFAGRTGGRRDYPLRRSDNPDVIYGRDFDDHAVPIDQIEGEMGEIAIRGQVLAVDTRELRNGEKSIVIVTLTDFTDSIVIKIFTKNEHLKELLGEVKKGAFLKIKGVTAFDRFDSELTLGSVAGIKKIPDFTERRMDTSPQKRVELHCHTKMSDMDGISDVGDIIKQAVSWGHKALAITDHGAIQAFPIANHAVPDGADFKIIYGVEAYLVDDLKQIVFAPKGQSLSDSYVVFDLETTGLSPNVHKIIEIGAVKVSDGKIVDRFSQFVNPLVPLPFAIEELTKIRDDMLVGEPEIAQVLPEFMEFCKGCVMVAHNAEFDMGFIQKNCEDLGLDCAFTVVDTVSMARYLLPGLNRFKLDTVAKELHISLKNHHRAVEDAECTAEIFLKFIQMLSERGIDDLDALNAQGKATAGEIMKKPT